MIEALDELNNDDVRQLTAALNRFSAVTEQSSAEVKSASTITIGAGGAGIWLCLTCCVIMLSVMIVGGTTCGLWMTREFTRIDSQLSERKNENERMQSYLSAIYAMAPQLKKPEKSNAE